MEQHYLLGEVARILGHRPHQISYLLTSGQVPEPGRRIANKRLFTKDDVQRLGHRFKVTPDWSVVERGDFDDDPAPDSRLTLRPPFDALPVGQSGHEVRDGDGAVFAWAGDRARALVIAGLLEAAARG
jgi:hypothetical protein